MSHIWKLVCFLVLLITTIISLPTQASRTYPYQSSSYQHELVYDDDYDSPAPSPSYHDDEFYDDDDYYYSPAPSPSHHDDEFYDDDDYYYSPAPSPSYDDDDYYYSPAPSPSYDDDDYYDYLAPSPSYHDDEFYDEEDYYSSSPSPSPSYEDEFYYSPDSSPSPSPSFKDELYDDEYYPSSPSPKTYPNNLAPDATEDYDNEDDDYDEAPAPTAESSTYSGVPNNDAATSVEDDNAGEAPDDEEVTKKNKRAVMIGYVMGAICLAGLGGFIYKKQKNQQKRNHPMYVQLSEKESLY